MLIVSANFGISVPEGLKFVLDALHALHRKMSQKISRLPIALHLPPQIQHPCKLIIWFISVLKHYWQ